MVDEPAKIEHRTEYLPGRKKRDGFSQIDSSGKMQGKVDSSGNLRLILFWAAQAIDIVSMGESLAVLIELVFAFTKLD